MAPVSPLGRQRETRDRFTEEARFLTLGCHMHRSDNLIGSLGRVFGRLPSYIETQNHAHGSRLLFLFLLAYFSFLPIALWGRGERAVV